MHFDYVVELLWPVALAWEFSLLIFRRLSTPWFEKWLWEWMNYSDWLQQVIDSLQRGGRPVETLRLGEQLPSLLSEMGAPAYLVRLLQNIHSVTWMTIGARGLLQTHKGTRPGSPLAEAIFHFLMFDVSRAFARISWWFRSPCFCSWSVNHLHMDIDMIIWSDDLEVPIITERNQDLVPALFGLPKFIGSQFQQRGFLYSISARAKLVW